MKTKEQINNENIKADKCHYSIRNAIRQHDKIPCLCDKCQKEKKQGLPSLSFIFGSIKYFENLIFDATKLFEPHVRICYFIRLKDKCQQEIDTVSLKNNKKEIFKYLDSIEDSKGD